MCEEMHASTCIQTCTPRSEQTRCSTILSGSTPDDANEDKDDVTDARKVLDVSSGRDAVLPTYHQPLCPAHSKDDARFTKSPCRKRCRANDELVSMLAEEEHPARMPPGKRFDVPGVSNSR